MTFSSTLPHIVNPAIGGKAKPLKAPKKAPKGELDEEDLAFKEKQRAGMRGSIGTISG